MKKILIITTAIFMALSGSYASVVDIMIGARGAGFGGAYSALVHDPSAAYWNPAGLPQVKYISIMENNWILSDVEGINVNYVTAALPIKKIGTISGSWLLKSASLEEFDGDKSDFRMHSFSLSVGRQLWEKLAIFEKTSIGFSLNRHVIRSETEDGAGLGFDVGIQTGLPAGFSFAFVARSIGSEVMGEKNDPELRWGLGFNKTIKDMHRITVGIDAVLKTNRDYEDEATLSGADRNLKTLGGLEYAIIIKDIEIALRGGLSASRYSSLGTYHYSVGAGFKYKTYALEYALTSDTDRDVAIGMGHQISLVIGFNKVLNDD